MQARFPFRAAAMVLAALPLPAQEILRPVPPGREVRDSKLLTLGKTDRWELRAAAGEVLHCKVDSRAFDPVLELVDSDGDVLGRHDGEGTSSELFVQVRVAGPVAFRVQGYEGRGGGQYGFYLQRYRTEAIAPGEAREHRFGRERWWHYQVELRAGDILVPTATGAGRVTAVFDMERRNLGAVLGGYRATRDGACLVRVEGDAKRACRFACQLARQRDLPAAGRVDERLPPHGFDLWRVTLRRGAAYALRWQMPGPQLEVLLPDRPDRHGPAFVWTGALGKGGDHRRWLVARRDCELELLLRNKTGLPAPYRAALAVPDVELADGTTVEGRLPLGGGAVYRLSTRPGQLLRIAMTSASFDGQFDLWAPDGRVLAQCDDRGPLDRNPELTFLVDEPGPHRLLVFSPGGHASGTYTVRAEVLPVPQLEPGSPLELQVAARGTAYCHLHLDRDQEIWLSLRSRSFDVAATLLGPDGRRLATWEGGGLGTDVLAAFRAPGPGRYTLEVHSRSGAGTCVARAVRPGR